MVGECHVDALYCSYECLHWCEMEGLVDNLVGAHVYIYSKF